jgi:predicted ATPase
VRQHGSLALRTGHDPGVAHGVYLAWSSWMVGYPDQALRHVLEMVELADRLAHPMTIAYALCFAALIRNHRGEHLEAKALAERALSITLPNKFALWTAWGKLQRGWAEAGLQQYELGIPEMQDGLEAWKSTGARVGFTFFPVTLAEMCLRAGRTEQAAQLLDEASPLCLANDEHFYEPELYRLKGELAGVDEHAVRHLELGSELAARLNGRSWALRLATSQARLLQQRGERSEARRLLREQYGWFSEGHETADLRAARALLDAMQP